jgi:Acetyltransferase (GNAT) domain
MPYYSNADFFKLSPGLRAAFACGTRESFFALAQWYDLMVRLAVPVGTEIRVYTDEQPGSMVAVPMQVSSADRARCLASLANFYSIEHGIVAEPHADLGRGLGRVISEILAERPRWDYLRLTELDPRDASYNALVRALQQAGFFVECGAGAATWYEETSNLNFTEYLASRPQQLRNTWRRKRRRINAAGNLAACFFSDPSGIEAAIADYQTIYAASWKPPEPFPKFIPALIRLAAELGALRLGLYRIDGIPAAAQFWIVWRGRAIIYKLAHDPRFDKLSLGTLLTMEMIERVLEQDRPDEINFGRGDDPYKRLWLSKRRERWGITAANPWTPRGLRLGLERELAKLYHRMRGEAIMPEITRVVAIQ